MNSHDLTVSLRITNQAEKISIVIVKTGDLKKIWRLIVPLAYTGTLRYFN